MLELKRNEKEINPINLFFEKKFEGFPFLAWFLSFSVTHALLYEKFDYERKVEKNNVELIQAINYVYNDLGLFLDFMYVTNIYEQGKKSFNEKNIKKFLFRIFIYLKLNKIIEIKKICVIKEKPKTGVRWANMVEFDNKTTPKIVTTAFKTSNNPATIKKKEKTILIGFYFYSMHTYALSEKVNKEVSEVSENFLLTLEKIANTAFYVDQEMLEIVSKQLLAANTDNLAQETIILKKKHAERAQLLNSNNKNLEEIIEELNYLKYLIKKTQKKISLSIDVWIFEVFKKSIMGYMDEPIYFLPYADFRGRIYFKSLISPQGGWIFRFLYNFGEESKENNVDLDLKVLEQEKETIDELKKHGVEKWKWIFLSIGFKFKAELNAEHGGIVVDRFIKKGLEVYLEFKDKFELLFDKFSEKMDAIEAIYYITLINNLRKGNLTKRYIIKDTTASVYQHLGKVLLFRDEKSLKITNLRSKNVWYDTYAPLLQEIKKNLDPEVQEYFQRKSLKKIFMTTKYNIGRTSAVEYYLNEISYIDDKLKFKKILKIFQKIYSRLKSGELEREILYKKDIKELNNRLSTQTYIELEDIKLSLIYYLFKEDEICIFAEGNRYTMANYVKTNIPDIRQMQIANLPNLIHALDALYARRIINTLSAFNIEVFTIHDAFGVPYNQLDLLIISAWDSIKIEEKFTFVEGSNNPTKADSVTILI